MHKTALYKRNTPCTIGEKTGRIKPILLSPRGVCMKLVLGSLAALLYVHLVATEVKATPSTPVSATSGRELIEGQLPPEIVLSEKKGGLVDGDTPWSSMSLQGKVSVLFYVAPAHKDMNEAVSTALREAQFPREKFQSYAIVNMAASSWPNFVIESKLKTSQKEFPRTQYVKDKEKVLVSQWKLLDDSSNVVVFDKTGSVLFLVKGKATPDQISHLIQLVRSHL
jgi:YtfJ family uncharacterized protein